MSELSHFSEWLSLIQGKAHVPEDVVAAVQQQLRDGHEVTRDCVIDVLKRLEMRKYIEYAPSIVLRLGGFVPHIPMELEERVKQMYGEVRAVYRELFPGKSFLPCYYVLRKLLEVLNKNELAETLPYIRSAEKLAQYDKVWCVLDKSLQKESHAKLHAIAMRNVASCNGRPPVAHNNFNASCDVCSTEQCVRVMSMGLSWRSGWVLACDRCIPNFPNYAMPLCRE